MNQRSSAPWEQVPTGDRTSAKANGRQLIRKSRPLGTRKWQLETVYAVTSLLSYQTIPTPLAHWVPGHWGIENGPLA